MSDSTRKTPSLPKPPTWLIYFVVVAVTASWIPLALIALARTTKSDKPRVHIFQDMDVQPKLHPQGFAPELFADHRAMRKPVKGTVARGKLRLDDHYYRGYETDENLDPVVENQQPKWMTGLPDDVKLDEALLQRGRERYNIYCAVCHGENGRGDGMVQRRVQSLAQNVSPNVVTGWVQPFNLLQRDPNSGKLLYGEPMYPAGKLFHTISHGARSMSGYASQISVADRWAIVAYVQAMQFAADVPADQIPDDIDRSKIAAAPEPPAEPEPAADGEGVDYSDPKLIAKGKTLFQSKACFTCHKVEGFPDMPTHQQAPSYVGGLFGREEEVHLGVGGPIETIVVDVEYFRESVKNPLAKIVKGYQPIMPPIPVTDDELDALTAFTKSLGEAEK